MKIRLSGTGKIALSPAKPTRRSLQYCNAGKSKLTKIDRPQPFYRNVNGDTLPAELRVPNLM